MYFTCNTAAGGSVAERTARVREAGDHTGGANREGTNKEKLRDTGKWSWGLWRSGRGGCSDSSGCYHALGLEGGGAPRGEWRMSLFGEYTDFELCLGCPEGSVHLELRSEMC